MTQEDVVRRMINQKGCQEISCLGRTGSWNQGVECPFNEKGGGCRVGSGDEYDDEVVPEAKAWINERGLPLYSTTFEIEHRFKPGDRVQRKDEALPYIITVEKVEFSPDYGAVYRLVNAEGHSLTGILSLCDQNYRLAGCDNEANQAKEMQS
jgi:hypothetical protein